MVKYVVVGGGVGGVACVGELCRVRQPSDTIVLVSASVTVKGVSNFVKVSDALETFDVEDKALASLQDEHGSYLSVVHGIIRSIDDGAKLLRLADGNVLQYDRICLCTGGSPKLVVHHPLVLGLRDTTTVQELAERLKTARRIVLLGNGGIALGLVHAIRSVEVMWAVKDGYIGNTFFDASASEFFLSDPKAQIDVTVAPPPVATGVSTKGADDVAMAEDGDGAGDDCVDAYAGGSATATIDDSHTAAAEFTHSNDTIQQHFARSSDRATVGAEILGSGRTLNAGGEGSTSTPFVPLPQRAGGRRGKRTPMLDLPADSVHSVGDNTEGDDAMQQEVTATTALAPPASATSTDAEPRAEPGSRSAEPASSAGYGSSLGPAWVQALRQCTDTTAPAPAPTEQHADNDGVSGRGKPVVLETRVELQALRGSGALGRVGVLADGGWHSIAEIQAIQSGILPSKQSGDPQQDAQEDHSLEHGWPLYVRLSNGRVYGCDFAVSATGVHPLTSMLPSRALSPFVRHSDGGLVVNKLMQTTGSPDIYAAGDCAAVLWPRSHALAENVELGKESVLDVGARVPLWFQMRLWNQARVQGAYAARCMADALDSLEAEEGGFSFELFAHMTKFLGYKVVLLGLFNGQGLGAAYEQALRTQVVTDAGLKRQADGTTFTASGGSGASSAATSGTSEASGALQASASPVQVQLRVTPGHEYCKVVLLHGRVVGAMLIGDTDLEETMEHLILNRIDLRRRKPRMTLHEAEFNRGGGGGGDHVSPADRDDGPGAGGEDGHGEPLDLLDPDIDIEDYFD